MRDLETIRLALTAAETGHLVFGTLHTSSAAKTVDRIVDVFPAAEKEMVRAMLSESLIGVISQTLCKTKDGSGRVAAHEIMLGTAAIRNLIREAKIAQMYSAIQTGNSMGMQTLDQNLADLVRRNIISAPEARSKAKFPENFPADRKETAMERDQASKFVNDLLRLMVSRNGSDLFLTADFPPAIKVDGKVTKVSPQPLSGQHTLALTRSIMNDKQAASSSAARSATSRRAAGHRPLPRQRLRAAGPRRARDADDPAGAADGRQHEPARTSSRTWR
jgi:Tfp pilus assembly pilus retraction ATPase PilT